jgi:hypothetical protein
VRCHRSPPSAIAAEDPNQSGQRTWDKNGQRACEEGKPEPAKYESGNRQ